MKMTECHDYRQDCPHGTTALLSPHEYLSLIFFVLGIMGGHHRNAEAEPTTKQDVQAMKDAKIPLAFRDKCGHLLIDLNKCRRANYFSPNACGHQRHTYEECEYYAWLDRVKIKSEQN